MNKRIKSKLRSNCILVVDVCCLPPMWDIDKWYKITKQYGLAVYDSKQLSVFAPFPISTIPKRNIKGYKVVKYNKAVHDKLI